MHNCDELAPAACEALELSRVSEKRINLAPGTDAGIPGSGSSWLAFPGTKLSDGSDLR